MVGCLRRGGEGAPFRDKLVRTPDPHMTMPPGRGDLGFVFSSLLAGRRTISNLHVPIRETHSNRSSGTCSNGTCSKRRRLVWGPRGPCTSVLSCTRSPHQARPTNEDTLFSSFCRFLPAEAQSLSGSALNRHTWVLIGQLESCAGP